MDNLPLIEKYRPKNFDEMVACKHIEELKQSIADPKTMPNLLLYGPPGTGKTTSAKILLKLLSPIDFVKIHGSDTTGVDTIRDKVFSFMTSMSSVKDKPKIIWIEEFDFMCLDPETEIIIGTLENQKVIKIKDVIKENTPIISFNTETKKLENDVCSPLPTHEMDVYTIELEDGRTIEATMEHPFFIEENGKIIEKNLKDSQKNDSIIDLSEEINRNI